MRTSIETSQGKQSESCSDQVTPGNRLVSGSPQLIDNRLDAGKQSSLRAIAENSQPATQFRQLKVLIDNAIPRHSMQMQKRAIYSDFSDRSTQTIAERVKPALQMKNGHGINNAESQKSKDGNVAVKIASEVAQFKKVGTEIKSRFTSMPKGVLSTKYVDHTIQADFDMKAKFAPDYLETGRSGQYRQYVRGFFRTTDAKGQVSDLKHPLTPGQYLDEKKWQEDGTAEGGYGHRPCNIEGDKYIEADYGSDYHGHDAPESDPINAGETVHMYLEFNGQLIETGGGKADEITDTRAWKIDKKESR